MTDQRFFKGWAIPGREILPDDAQALGEGETLDALSGHFRIFQLKNGHRFSTDDLLVAWYGTSNCPSASRVLELGSGIGTVGMVAAWRLTGASFVTIEAQAESHRLALKSLQHNGLLSRFDARVGDFRALEILAPDSRFDLVLGSPPYFPLDSGMLADHPQKVACRFEVRGSIADYCEVASRHLAAGAMFACVFPIEPAHQLERIRAAARNSGMTIVKWRGVVLKEGEAPLLGVFAMIRSGDLPEKFRVEGWREPDLVIRRRDGSVHPEYSAIKLGIGFPP